MNIGSISASLAFAAGVSDEALKPAFEPFLVPDDDGEPTLDGSLTDKFAALCDLALQSLIRERRQRFASLRVDVSYGNPDYRRGWVLLGTELMVGEDEMAAAQTFLGNFEVANSFELRLVAATQRFKLDHLPLPCLAEARASFYLHEDPIWDSEA